MKKFIHNKIRQSFLQAMSKTSNGRLTIFNPDGSAMRYGQAGDLGPDDVSAQLVVHDWSFITAVAMRGDIGLAETYVDELWDTDSLENLILFFLRNMESLESYAHGRFMQRAIFWVINNIFRRNSRRGSRANIHAHYDVGNEFYKLWLDQTMTYSSALFENDRVDLAAAQQAKYQRILSRLEQNHAEILEIGCGWGGFAEQAAEMGKKVTGVTISPAQYEFAARRLDGKADIRLQDYRDTQGKYDSIVSIEMFEAVGERYWPDYFRTVKERLASHGKAIIQTITIDDRLFKAYKKRSDFIRHYIFPGGMLPGVSQFMKEAEKAGLKCSDPFSFGKDYARTLRVWLERFEAAKPEIERMGYNRQFQRSWRFYLAMCAAAFAVGRTDVVHFELSHAA